MIDKKYLTFHELVERWGIPSNDIHYLIQQKKLIPSIVWDMCFYNVKIRDISFDYDETLFFEEQDMTEDGDYIYYESDPSETLYLIKPRSNGAYKYVFTYATRNVTASHERVLKLCKTHGGQDKTFDETYIEENGFFMMDLIEVCEVFEFSQTKISQSSKSKRHVSNMLAYLNQASEKFWANAVEEETDTHPKNIDVEKWLIDRGYSESLARKAASIIRPEWASKGRPKEN